MARISGVDLPRNKKIEFALQYIYGIGKSYSKNILEKTNINPDVRVNELKEDQIIAIRDEISNNYTVEGELRALNGRSIKRLIDIGSYRGMRHKKGLPVRGQNTKNNSRTRKGKKKTIAGKKKAI
ncbi:MAG: 30S ribosomal protein S13 [Candidatus Marinimicrobia bacterium]|nr:30S ribosomal protein S13 [Candidatus Neomarinimicrobiota bacterium]